MNRIGDKPNWRCPFSIGLAKAQLSVNPVTPLCCRTILIETPDSLLGNALAFASRPVNAFRSVLCKWGERIPPQSQPY